MPGDAASAISPVVRIETIPGMSRGGDGRLRGVVLARGDAALVDRVLTLVPPASDGQAAPVYVLDPEGRMERGSTWGSRVRVYSGGDGVGRLLSDRRERLACSLPESVATVLDGEPALPPALVQGLQALAQQQVMRSREVGARLAARWQSRGVSYWQSRLGERRDAHRPATVLVITSRYSTYVRHAAEDLVESMKRLGHDARLFLEPDEHETLTSIAYLEAIDRWDPDLIVAINFPRWAMGGAVPEGWPYVCWVQDALQHLFMGSSVAGPLDFVIGHVYPDAMRRAGYQPEQLLDHRVCVSESKFHPGPVTADQSARFSCDIAYVSHRSETPEEFAGRFWGESGLPSGARAEVEESRVRIDAIIGRWADGPAANELVAVASDLARALGRDDDPRATEVLSHRFVRPYAEQRLRNQTLEWAGEIAGRRGFSLRLFGRGWERHPTLASFAAGPLAHGDDLRACYQSAALHLHVSIEGCGHQRVAECALSGGLPICRRSWAEMYYNDWQAAREFVSNPPPADVFLTHPRWPAHVVADHPALMHLVRSRALMLRQTVAWDHEYLQGLYAQAAHATYKPFDAPVPPRHARSLALFGDAMESTFSTREELEGRIVRAVARGSWRRQMSEGTARRAAECVGASRFAERLVRFAIDGLSPAGPIAIVRHESVAEAVA